VSEAQPSSSHRSRWLVAAGVTVAVLVAAGVGAAVAASLDTDSSSSTSASSEPPAVCPAVRIARKTLPSVVTIEVQTAGASGSGSGEVIRPDGEILTNDHVVSAGAASGTVSVIFSDGDRESATIVGRDPATDLAVVKVNTGKSLRVIPFGKSSQLDVGQPVVALGAPLGLSSTVTTGIVSALERSVQLPSDGTVSALLVGAIQTDAAINPGNSGGALVDCSGKLVGVPTAGAVVPGPNGPSAGNIGIGFAIPSEFAKIPPSTARDGRESGGLYVVAVAPAGPSDQAGLRPGDVMTEIDGETLSTAQQLQAITLTKRPGETVTVVYRRNGTTHSTTLTLGPLTSTP